MKDYRIQIRLLAPLGTPWQSDTVFGHLCWQVVYGRGDLGIEEFLAPFREGRPPFVLSDGFPGDLLPRPLVPEKRSQKSSAASYAATKARKRSRFIRLTDLQAFREGGDLPIAPISTTWRTFEVPYAAIHRHTGTTGPTERVEGGSFFSTELIAPDAGDLLSLYLRAEGEWGQWVVGMLKEMAPLGFGRDRSTGTGAYEVLGMEPFEGFAPLPEANAFLSLSSYCPAQGDPTKGYWRVRLKYGKLGETASSGNPFKRPLIQFEPGALFFVTDGPVRPYYGRAVPHIAPGMPEAIQCGYTLAVACQRPATDWEKEAP
ncbi:MAG: type III-A CRISPR-associated RAMP protein Csm4 [Candidatus Zipacnadales bacterium]